MSERLKAELAVLAEQKGWLDAQRGKPAPQIEAEPHAEQTESHAEEAEPVPVGLWQRLKGKLGRE